LVEFLFGEYFSEFSASQGTVDTGLRGVLMLITDVGWPGCFSFYFFKVDFRLGLLDSILPSIPSRKMLIYFFA